MGLVRHVVLDFHGTPVQLLAGACRVDLRKWDGLDPLSPEAFPQRIQAAHVDSRGLLDGGSIALHLAETPRLKNRPCRGKIMLEEDGLQPAQARRCGKALDLVGKTSADSLPPISRRNH